MINAVLVGCGAMSKAWLDAIRQIDGLAIVGLVDLDADRARARAQEYDLTDPVIGSNLDAVLDQTK
ncbi:gfo/Idh/MocA family oxidoreductase, partial [Mesorhizobium sp. M7A.F.Ca.ET.027.03.2.1]